MISIILTELASDIMKHEEAMESAINSKDNKYGVEDRIKIIKHHLGEIVKTEKMIEKGYWQNYLETIKIGESIDCNDEERVFFDFDISSELNTIAKGNSNNAKLLLISAIREVLANNQINLFLAFELSNFLSCKF